MQRFGSMKKCSESGLAMALLLRLQHTVVLRRAVGFADFTAAYFVLRDLADRILRGDRHLIRTLFSRPVIRHEYRVRPDRRDHGGAHGQRPATGLDGRPIAGGDTQALREPGMHFDERFRTLLDERTDAACL